MQAMILAAGLGTRLWPLTADRGKPAVPFLGRPLIAGLAEWLGGHGFDRLVVNTHHQPESIRRALVDLPGLRIEFSHEDQILGTAGGLALARDRGLLDPTEAVLVVNGKLHTDLDLAAVQRAHQRSGASVTMVLRPNPAREHFREVLVDGPWVSGFGEGRIPSGPAPLLFTGIHILGPSVLAGLKPRFSDTVADVYPPLIADRRVHAHLAPEGRWWEFSTLRRYFDLQMIGVDSPQVIAGPDVVIQPGAQVRRAILWEGATIEAGAHLEDVVIGAKVTVRRGEQFRGGALVRRDLLAGDDRGVVHGDRVLVPFEA